MKVHPGEGRGPDCARGRPASAHPPWAPASAGVGYVVQAAGCGYRSTANPSALVGGSNKAVISSNCACVMR